MIALRISAVGLAALWCCHSASCEPRPFQSCPKPTDAAAAGQVRRHNCTATIQYTTGVYTGEFQNDERSGHGEWLYPSGAKYVGEFRDGLPNGQGVYTFPNGQKYVGEFKDGNFHGTGVLYSSNGSVVSQGSWVDNKPVAAGRAGKAAVELRSRTGPNGEDEIEMKRVGNLYVVPIRLNGVISVNAIVDSGASTVYIPAGIISELQNYHTVSPQDVLAKGVSVNADGSRSATALFRIHTLEVGGKTVEDIVASVGSPHGLMLLGQSFLRKFSSWSIDNERHVLILK